MECKWGLCDLAKSRGRRPRASGRAERGARWGPEDDRENEESCQPSLDNMLFFSHFSFSTSLSALNVDFAFVSLTIIRSHRPHLPSLGISARLFCPGNAPIELPGEEAKSCTELTNAERTSQ